MLVEPGKPAAAAQTMSMADAAEQKRSLAKQSEALQAAMCQIEHQRAAEATQAKAKAQAAEKFLEQQSTAAMAQAKVEADATERRRVAEEGMLADRQAAMELQEHQQRDTAAQAAERQRAAAAEAAEHEWDAAAMRSNTQEL